MTAFAPVARRSDPFGWQLYYEITVAPGRELRRFIVALEDGQRPIYDVILPGTADVHANRGLSAKPVFNGTWPFTLYLVDDLNQVFVLRCAPGVTVVP